MKAEKRHHILRVLHIVSQPTGTCLVCESGPVCLCHVIDSFEKTVINVKYST